MEVFEFALFEEGQRVRTRDILHVTLNGEYRLLFNRLALAALGDPDGVALMYDARRQVIGVLPSALNRPHAYQLRKKLNMGAARLITVKNFCEHHDIKPEGTLAFPEAYVNKDGVLILDLHRAKAVKRKGTSDK